MEFTIDLIREAEERIRPYVIKTPLIRLEVLDKFLGCHVFIKAECMQTTGAFKIRGAMNMLLALGEDAISSGIVTASSGNHGRGCAYAAKMLGIPCTVIIPDTAPEIKVQNVLKLGAEVIRCPAIDRFNVAKRICAEKGAAFIPPYDHELIMAGQGTAGLEIMEQMPHLDTVLVSTSGGGLTSGIAAAIKGIDPAVRVIGVEPLEIPRYRESLKAGHPVEVEQKITVADALVSNHPGEKCFPVVKKYTDGVVTASEESIRSAQKLLLTEGKILAEPSGCMGIAALLEKKICVGKDENVCILISGGNCDIRSIEL